eukprot:508366-Amphidinium_carterae.1
MLLWLKKQQATSNTRTQNREFRSAQNQLKKYEQHILSHSQVKIVSFGGWVFGELVCSLAHILDKSNFNILNSSRNNIALREPQLRRYHTGEDFQYTSRPAPTKIPKLHTFVPIGQC